MTFEVLLLITITVSRNKGHYNLQLTKFLGTYQVFPFGNLSSEVSRAPCGSTVGYDEPPAKNRCVCDRSLVQNLEMSALNVSQILRIYSQKIRRNLDATKDKSTKSCAHTQDVTMFSNGRTVKINQTEVHFPHKFTALISLDRDHEICTKV